MADATTTTTGDVSGGNTGLVVILEQLAAAVAALQGSVQTLTSQSGATAAMQSQMQDTLKSLTENQSKLSEGLASLTDNVNKLAVSTETDVAYTLRDSGVRNPADHESRIMNERDKTAGTALQAVVDMVKHASDIDLRRLALIDQYLEYNAGVLHRGLDHFDLGRHTVRAPSGPGNQDTKANM